MRIIKRFAEFISESENKLEESKSSIERNIEYYKELVSNDKKRLKNATGGEAEMILQNLAYNQKMLSKARRQLKLEESEKGVDLRDDKSCKCKGCGNPVKEGLLLCEKCEDRGFYIAANGKVVSPEDALDEQADAKHKVYPGKLRHTAFCTLCGTKMSDPKSGYCINGHDSWLEKQDLGNEYGEKFAKMQKITLDDLQKMFNSNKDIKISKPFQI